MREYRIKRTYEGWEVERKGFFGWKNCVKTRSVLDGRYDTSKTFYSYREAKEQLEHHMKYDGIQDERRQARKAFKIRYYYPPLPDEEPTGDEYNAT